MGIQSFSSLKHFCKIIPPLNIYTLFFQWTTLLGIALILMGTFEVILGFAGASAPAVITSIRREGDERADGTSTVCVLYFPAFPYINNMERDAGLGAGQLVLIIAGMTLIFLMNMKTGERSVAFCIFTTESLYNTS